MATNHIELQGNESRLASKFRSLVDRTSQLQDEMKRMKFVMDEAGASSQDWTAIEALFGFQPGNGQAAYVLLQAAAVKINSADCDNFCNRIG